LLGLSTLTDDISPQAIVADFFIELVQNSSVNDGNDVREFCQAQSGETYNLTGFINSFRQAFPEPDREDYFQQNFTDQSNPDSAKRIGLWLRCNEIGLFPASDSPRFLVNLSYFERVCQYLFNLSLPDQSDLSRRFGNVLPDTTNIIFTNAKNDSWSKIGIGLSDGVESRREFIVKYENASYCAELFAPQLSSIQSEPQSVTDARTDIFKNLSTWIVNDTAINCTHGTLEFGRCICDPDYEGELCDSRTMSETIVKVFAALLVLLPMAMMIVIGCAAWFLFLEEMKQDQNK
jgi:hypothetical protein